MKVTNEMQLYRLIYYLLFIIHVSGNVFAYHQEHLTVFTVSGSVHPSCCRLVSNSGVEYILTESGTYTSNNLPRMQNQRLLVQF
jgi:hypothetical protein